MMKKNAVPSSWIMAFWLWAMEHIKVQITGWLRTGETLADTVI